MEKVCVDPLCRLTASSEPPRQLFRIPQILEDAKAWLEFIHSIGGKLANPFDEKARQNVLLCDRHFNHCCFGSSIGSPNLEIRPGHYPTKRIDNFIVHTQARSNCGPVVGAPMSDFDNSDIFDFCFPNQSVLRGSELSDTMTTPSPDPVSMTPKGRRYKWVEDFREMSEKYDQLHSAYKKLKEEHETLASKWRVTRRRMIAAEKLSTTLVCRNNMITKRYLHCKQQLQHRNTRLIRVINLNSHSDVMTNTFPS